MTTQKINSIYTVEMKRNLFLSLGSNIEPRNDYLNQARLLLNEKFKFVTASSVYETAPLLDLNQNSFYNQILLQNGYY